MYVLAVRGTLHPGTADAFAQRWRDFYGSRLTTIPGFAHAYCTADRAKNAILVVSVWQERPQDAPFREAMQAFGAQVSDLAVGPPTTEWYEVLAHIAPSR